MIMKLGRTSLGQVAVNAFSVWVGLGATIGLWRVVQSAPQRQVGIWLNAGLFVLFSTLAGARLFYVRLNWEYFSNHLLEAAMISLGGLTWPGAFAGAGLGLGLLVIRQHALRTRPDLPTIYSTLGIIADQLYPLLAPLAITAWVGCWQSGIAYGAALPAGTWWGIPAPDETGMVSTRFPLQPLAALTLVAFFWILETKVKPLRPTGRLCGLAAGGLLLHLAAASLLRADPAPTWNGLRLDTWFALLYLALLIALGLTRALAVRAIQKTPYPPPERSST